MRRTLAALAAATSLALGGAVVVAGPAAAAEPSVKSVHTYCPGAADNTHPGKHKGWEKEAGTERRNLGGTCMGPELSAG